MPSPGEPRAAAIRFIVCLGIVSLFADMTYEGARGITGPFLRDLGASAAAVGFIAGLAEMLGFTLRLASGRLADRTHAYWTLTILGYLLNLTLVPLLAFAGNWKTAALLIVAERTAKSVRAPARDVLLSEAAVAVGTGWGFGLHTGLDQIGAVLGPLMVAAAVARTHSSGPNSYAPAFLSLAFPAAAALAALLVARAVYASDRTPSGHTPGTAPGSPEAHRDGPAPKPHPLPKIFWSYVAAAGLLAAGFVDFPLLAYHLEKTGLAPSTAIPLLYAGAMAVNGITPLLFGKLFDRFGIAVLASAIPVSLAALPLVFLAGSWSGVVAGVACWGAGMGAQDALLRAGISRVVSMDKRGTAFGAFNAVYGLMWFLGSASMGLLYDRSIGALVVFGVTAQLAAAVMFAILARGMGRPRSAAGQVPGR